MPAAKRLIVFIEVLALPVSILLMSHWATPVFLDSWTWVMPKTLLVMYKTRNMLYSEVSGVFVFICDFTSQFDLLQTSHYRLVRPNQLCFMTCQWNVYSTVAD